MTPADMREAAALLVDTAEPGTLRMMLAARVRALPIPEAPLPGIDLGAVEAALAVMAKAPWRTELDRNGQENIRADNEMWVALLPNQCVAAIETEQQANAAAIVLLRNQGPALCAALRSVTAERDALLAERQRRNDERDAWEGSIVDKATARIARSDQASHEARERLRAVARETAAERDAAKKVADTYEAWIGTQIDTSEAWEEYVSALALRLGCEHEWSNLHDHRACIDKAIAALTSAGQEQAVPVPTPEEMVLAEGLDGAAGSAGLFADGVRAQRALGWPVIAPERDHEKRYRLMRADAERVIAQVIAERDEFEAAHLAALATNGALQRERDEARRALEEYRYEDRERKDIA